MCSLVLCDRNKKSLIILSFALISVNCIFSGHNGTVWCVDVRWDSTLLITGSADNSCRLWDVQTGECICAIETKSAVRSCGWSYSGNQIFYSTDKTMGQISELRLYTLVDINKSNGGQAVPYLVIPSPESKITSVRVRAASDFLVFVYFVAVFNCGLVKRAALYSFRHT